MRWSRGLLALVACAALSCRAEPRVRGPRTEVHVRVYRDSQRRASNPLGATAPTAPGGTALVVARIAAEVKAGVARVPLPRGADLGSLAIDLRSQGRVVSARVRRAPASSVELGTRIGQEVEVVSSKQTVRGRLVAVDDHMLTVERRERVVALARDEIVSVGFRDPALGAEPRLEVEVADTGPVAAFDLVYAIASDSWAVDYRVELGDGRGWLSAVLTLENRGGIRSSPARVTLYQGQLTPERGSARRVWSGSVELDPAGATQVPLLSDLAVGAHERYLYSGAMEPIAGNPLDPATGTHSRFEVEAQVILDACAAEGIELLPPGAATVTGARDAAGFERKASLREVASIPGEVAMVVGVAGHLRGERKQIDFVAKPDGSEVRETYEYTIYNSGSEDAEVLVREPLVRSRKARLRRSEPPATLGTDAITAVLSVPAGGQARALLDIVYQL